MLPSRRRQGLNPALGHLLPHHWFCRKSRGAPRGRVPEQLSLGHVSGSCIWDVSGSMCLCHMSETRVWVHVARTRLGPCVWVMCLGPCVWDTCLGPCVWVTCLGPCLWDACLGGVSGAWHAGSVRLRDEASRQALTLLRSGPVFRPGSPGALLE